MNLGDMDFDVDILGGVPDWKVVQGVIDGCVTANVSGTDPLFWGTDPLF